MGAQHVGPQQTLLGRALTKTRTSSFSRWFGKALINNRTSSFSRRKILGFYEDSLVVELVEEVWLSFAKTRAFSSFINLRAALLWRSWRR